MKVIAKKIYYEQDLYQYPDENVSYGLFPLEVGKPSPIRKGPERVYKKGDIKEEKFEIERYCCEEMEKIPETVILFKYLPKFKVNEELIYSTPGCYIRCPCWEIKEFYRIGYCPFCGKKIEIVEEES